MSNDSNRPESTEGVPKVSPNDEIDLIGHNLRELAKLDAKARTRVVDYLTSYVEDLARMEQANKPSSPPPPEPPRPMRPPQSMASR